MNRRFLVSIFKASVLFVLLLCLGCSAQSNDSEVSRRIDHQIRSTFGLPSRAKIEIGSRKPSEFANYDSLPVTVSVGDHKQTKDFLLSKDGKTLVIQTKMDLTKDPYAETMAKIDTNGRPFRGNKDAKVVIVNYDDFQCPFCGRMHQTLFNDVMKTYGDRVKVIYKDFPLDNIHPWATRAAVDSNCLAGQSNDAYWSFADRVHGNPGEISGDRGRPLPEQLATIDRIATEQGKKFNVDMGKLDACLKAQPAQAVKASVEEASKLGVQGTPALFINGAKLEGAVPADELRAFLDTALRDAGGSLPAATAAK